MKRQSISEKKMVTELQKKLSSFSEETKIKLMDEIETVKSFNASHGWYSKFMKRHGFRSRKGAGSEKHFSELFLSKERHDLHKQLAKFPFKAIMNKDEVAVLFRSLPNWTI